MYTAFLMHKILLQHQEEALSEISNNDPFEYVSFYDFFHRHNEKTSKYQQIIFFLKL